MGTFCFEAKSKSKRPMSHPFPVRSHVGISIVCVRAKVDDEMRKPRADPAGVMLLVRNEMNEALRDPREPYDCSP